MKQVRAIILSEAAPWLVLLGCLAASVIGWRIFMDAEIAHTRLRFTEEARAHKQDILDRMINYEQALRSGVSLFEASEEVSRDEWRVYANSLHLTTLFPGIQGYGWSIFVTPEELARHEAAIRAEGFPDYHVRPPGPRDLYSAIVFLEPFDTRNQRAFGYDMYAEPTRRKAMQRARDSGDAALSGRVTLVQEIDTEVQAGCLLYLPVYKKGMPLQSVEDRRAAIIGFVYAPFRMENLMAGILGNRHHLSALRIYDGNSVDSADLMVDSHRKEPVASVSGEHRLLDELEYAGHRWTLEFRSTRAFRETMDDSKALIVLGSGIISSLLLFAWILGLSRSRNRALILAERMTADLSASESRIRAILDTAVNGIITMGSDRAILSFNPAAEKIFGYQVEDVLGKNVNMLMPEPFRSRHDAFVERYLATGESQIIMVGGREVLGQHKNGNVFPMWLAVGEAVIEEARVFVGCVVDITEHKQVEAALRSAMEVAEAANRAKSDFLNTMSHELRTPLTVILGYLPLLMQAGAKLPVAKKVSAALENRPEAADFTKFVDQIGKMATEMKRNGEHLLTLINDLLDISKIEAGKLTLNRQPVPVRPLLEEVVNSLRASAESKGLRLMEAADPGTVFADEVRFKQILINLIGNAIKFTESGHIKVTGHTEGSMFAFEVADSGAGIPESELERVFDRFHQVDNSSTRKAGGTGLGLAITRKLVEISGGEISVASREGEGSCFRFTLPLHIQER